jgi:uncharacterized Zn finger protein
MPEILDIPTITEVECKKCGAINTIPYELDKTGDYQKFYYTCWYCGWVYAFEHCIRNERKMQKM